MWTCYLRADINNVTKEGKYLNALLLMQSNIMLAAYKTQSPTPAHVKYIILK